MMVIESNRSRHLGNLYHHIFPTQRQDCKTSHVPRIPKAIPNEFPQPLERKEIEADYGDSMDC